MYMLTKVKQIGANMYYCRRHHNPGRQYSKMWKYFMEMYIKQT